MRRREFLLMLTGAISAARPLRAQQRAMPIIGYLASSTPKTNVSLLPAFHRGLAEAGRVEG